MNHLEQRVARLEKSLHNYRIIFGISFIAICVFTLISSRKKDQFVPDTIQAKSFQVVDDNGKALVNIGKDGGNGSLATFNSSGQKLVNLFTTSSGAGGINTFDANGNVLFKVTNTIGGGSYLALFNSKAKEIVEFGNTDINSGYMRVNDKDGDKLAYITYTANGGGYFSLLNNKQEIIRFSTPNVGGRIGVSNAKNNRIIYLGAQENQDGNITIWNSGGTKLGSIPTNY